MDPTFTLAGPAFTVRYAPRGTRNGSVGDYVDDLPPGQVVVLDNAGRTDVTVWGDILTLVASRAGLGGTVIDGVCRDVARSVELSYPVFARGNWMRTGKDRVQVEQYDGPVHVGGVRVEPGDLMVGDRDGVLAVPAEHAPQVLEVARAIAEAEDRIRERVRTGERLRDARIALNYHHLQTRTK
jgi:regulator of RNase E activity RraA